MNDILGIPISRFTYSALLLATYIIPAGYTLIHRRMLRQYGYGLLNRTVLIAAIPFVIWDLVAVGNGYWRFNPRYTTPARVAGLPWEELLFFLLIPQSSLLIWVAFVRYSHIREILTDIKKHFHRPRT